ncbi:hypothetical protein [Rhodobacter maris]|uniref:Uncharacterized protein n=1 Tax=Rhodobacter maris TaxID=446682 RepID=A0A285RZW2_9RHOB|nr:hypothetical protein [Rhodobacter maris]SOC00120.1 hypothetical protein SAMN05877831_102291 [Rhodobacter maris]
MPELGLFQNIWQNLAIVIAMSILIVWAGKSLGILNWKLLDLCVLAFGAVGFLTPAFEIQRMGFEMEASAQKGWTVGELLGLKMEADVLLINCQVSTRSEYSPPDFDLIVEERNKVCRWAKQFSDLVGGFDQDNYKEIPKEIFASLPSIREFSGGYQKDRILERLSDWNQHVQDRRSAEAMSQRMSPIELILLSPYLLALAFALAVAAVLWKPRQ